MMPWMYLPMLLGRENPLKTLGCLARAGKFASRYIAL